MRHRPRLLVAGLAAALLTWLVPSPASAAAPGSGFNDWNCRPSAAHPNPVLLLHGLGGNGPGNYLTLGPTLAKAGYCVYAPTYGEEIPGIPVGGLVPIDRSAGDIAGYVDKVLASTGAARLNLVGHSEGGFQSLYVPKFLAGYAGKIARVVALAPPTHGTTFANLVTIAQKLGILPQVTTILTAFGCPACAQLITGGSAITSLNTGPIAQPGIAYTVIASTSDELVTPYGTEFVNEPGVVNESVQSLCPADHVGHIGLAYDGDVAQMIQNALDPDHQTQVGCTRGLIF